MTYRILVRGWKISEDDLAGGTTHGWFACAPTESAARIIHRALRSEFPHPDDVWVVIEEEGRGARLLAL